MEHKRKKVLTRQSLTNRIKNIEGVLFAMTEHVSQLRDQQLLQHVELTALKQLLVEGRPITPESFNKRCNVIYSSLIQGVENDEQLPEGEPEGRESGGKAMVDEPHGVPT